jgi:membrane protein implicated in regulation of membrane protease activity
MTEKIHQRADVLDVVALLADRPSEHLGRGQVGTVVEPLDEKTVLVEFSDDQGRAYAITPLPVAEILVLHYVPRAA